MNDRALERLFFKPPIDEAGDGRTDNRRHPEHPQLRHGPTLDDQGRPGAACRVHRRVGHRNADQVNQGQAKTDRKGCESGRRPFVRGSQDDDQEHQGHHHFRDESGFH